MLRDAQLRRRVCHARGLSVFHRERLAPKETPTYCLAYLTQSGVSDQDRTRNGWVKTHLPFPLPLPHKPSQPAMCAGSQQPAKLPPAEATAWVGKTRGGGCSSALAHRLGRIGTGEGGRGMFRFAWLEASMFGGGLYGVLVSLFPCSTYPSGFLIRMIGAGVRNCLMWYHISSS